jgi:uncharacterized protein YqjF (DUF2071 family)
MRTDGPVEAVAIAPPLPGPVLFDMKWLHAAFLHWSVAPELVAPLLPVGTRPDLFDGVTYVGLVAFRMQRMGFGRGMPLPYLGDFPETNVRLYSVDDAGRHGVVFRSLESTRLLSVLGGRWGFRVPYTWARMRVRQRGDAWTYQARRRMPMPEVSTDIRIRVGEPIEPSPLDVFLTMRWGLHSRLAGRTVWTQNIHHPWRLHAAELLHLQDSLVPAGGVPVTGPPDVHVIWSPGVHTQFTLPRAV